VKVVTLRAVIELPAKCFCPAKDHIAGHVQMIGWYAVFKLGDIFRANRTNSSAQPEDFATTVYTWPFDLCWIGAIAEKGLSIDADIVVNFLNYVMFAGTHLTS
jgi:hypothetical protein